MTCSDEQLVAFVLDGHDLAFEVLFDRHVAESLWYAREVLGSWGEAEDAVRHSFAAANAYLAARGDETEFQPWLQTILGNYCMSMLHARGPAPDENVPDDSVVDLGEWRLRRKLFGISLPIAPGAGLREGLMAVCGVGAGANSAGAPLIGGTLAKLATVAVLAGGVGIAGNVAPDPVAPADAGTQAPAERIAAVGGPFGGADSPPVGEWAGRADGPTGPAERHHVALPWTARERALSPGQPPPGPLAGSPPAAVPAADAVTPAGSSSSEVTNAAALSSSPAQGALRRTVAAVEAQVRAGGGLPQAQADGPRDMAKIGDDLGVTALKPPVDVRTLLSRGVGVLSK